MRLFTEYPIIKCHHVNQSFIHVALAKEDIRCLQVDSFQNYGHYIQKLILLAGELKWGPVVCL